MIACPFIFGAAVAKKGRFHERSQYLLQSAYRVIHGPASPLDAQTETTGRGVWITEDVPELRIDYI